MEIIKREFYQRDTLLVAQELLGKILVREIDGQILSGIITETEAYTSNDPACHAFNGKTERTKAMFGPVGHCYIYFIYGNHFCMNVVSRKENDICGGVLIRAIKPLKGIEIMQKNRKTKDIKKISDGPGKLTQALKISKELYGIDLTKKGPLYLINNPELKAFKIEKSVRIGISKAVEKEWRFYIRI